MRSIQVTHRKDGATTYRVRFRHAGRQTSETFFVRRDAQTFAAVLANDGVAGALAWLDAKDNRAPTGWTFAEWFEHYVDHLTGVTERTRADYRAQHRRYLTELDQVPLAALTRAHVAAIVNRLDGEGRSPKTIKNAVNLLASCLASAVEEGHLTRNPAKSTRLPTAHHERDESELFLTHEQFATLLQHIPDHYRPLVVTLAGTGMRWSEATALEWKHVNTTTHTIRVAQAWKRVPGRGFELGPPKSKKSRRTVNAPPQVMSALREVRRAQDVERGVRVNMPGAFVFTTPLGHPVSHANFHARIWKPATKAAGLSIGIHGLRHTHASWLISLGMSLEQVQDQLGHESILTTRGTYGHLLPALGAQVGQAAGVALAQALASRGPATAELEA